MSGLVRNRKGPGNDGFDVTLGIFCCLDESVAKERVMRVICVPRCWGSRRTFEAHVLAKKAGVRKF